MIRVSNQEERYADGLAEYGSFYGGPSFDYLAPAKSASSTIQELPAEDEYHNVRGKSLYASTDSYDLITNKPGIERDTEGLQLAPLQTCSTTVPGHARALHLDVRYHIQVEPHAISSDRPAPPSDIHNTSGAQPQLYQFPSAPASPIHQHIFLQHSDHPSQPRPLEFVQRSSTMPPTPPMSYASSVSNGDTFSERLHSLHASGYYMHGFRQSESPKGALATLARINTSGSASSGRSSPYASSPLQPDPYSPLAPQQRSSIARSTTSDPGDDAPEMSPSDAQAELLRRLSSKEDTSGHKGSTNSYLKRGFTLKRPNTSTKAAGGPSQDALTDILEEVALEGNLALVKAVLALSADPCYRSNAKLKKIKHDALARASTNGRARVVDYLLRKGASYGEPAKKETYTPTDKALLTAAYKGHADLVACLICSHGANPMVEQWPREMYDAQHYWVENQIRLAKSSVLDAISKWKNVDRGMNLLKIIMQHPNFDPAALVASVFDNKSELQAEEFGYRPWQTTYEYSALSCYVRAGWADVVEEMLMVQGAAKEYEREEEVLQYQDKVNRYISPISALTKETWKERPEDALRILKLLIDRSFSLDLTQRTATDMGQRTALGRAISADAAQGVELILQSKPGLVRDEVFFRRFGKETKAQPLAAALALDSLEVARVLLRAGAHPRDPAFDNMNVLQFAAHQGGKTGTAILKEMIGLAPELTYNVLDIAITRINKDAVRVLLDTISTAALQGQIAALPPIHDTLLDCADTEKDNDTKTKYVDLIDMVVQWDAGFALQRPQLPTILSAIRRDNYVGMEKLFKVGVVDGKTLGLNSKAQPRGEQGLWTMLECCELTDRSAEWLGLLRYYGAPLY